MTITENLQDLGQSLWLDNITREILDNGTLRRYVDELSVTGLTSNPTIFDEAIGNTSAYDSGIRQKAQAGLSGEEIFVELALEDLRRAADVFRPVFDRSLQGIDGWVSMEVSSCCSRTTPEPPSMPHCAFTNRRIDFESLYQNPRCARRRPRHRGGHFRGRAGQQRPLLFSREHYLSVAEAYMRGIERRIAAGLDPRISSVASLFVSRWDGAVGDKVPQELRNRLGIAIAQRTYRAHCELIASKRWRSLEGRGRTQATYVMGQHRHQGSTIRGWLVRRGLGSSRHHRHYAGEDAAWRSPQTEPSNPSWRRMAATRLSKCSLSLREAIHRYRHARRLGYRSKERSRSSSLGPGSSETHRGKRARRWLPLEFKAQPACWPAGAGRGAGERTPAHHRLLQRAARSCNRSAARLPLVPQDIAAVRSSLVSTSFNALCNQSSHL